VIGSLDRSGRRRVVVTQTCALSIPPMPAWVMISVIAVGIVDWSVIGAWRMMTHNA
jgi:hypothetical protein